MTASSPQDDDELINYKSQILLKEELKEPKKVSMTTGRKRLTRFREDVIENENQSKGLTVPLNIQL